MVIFARLLTHNGWFAVSLLWTLLYCEDHVCVRLAWLCGLPNLHRSLRLRVLRLTCWFDAVKISYVHCVVVLLTVGYCGNSIAGWLEIWHFVPSLHMLQHSSKVARCFMRLDSIRRAVPLPSIVCYQRYYKSHSFFLCFYFDVIYAHFLSIKNPQTFCHIFWSTGEPSPVFTCTLFAMERGQISERI